MAIPNVSISSLINSTGNPTVSNAAAPTVDRTPSSDNQPSATVTISAQGQKLSQAQTSSVQANQTQVSSTVDTAVTPNAVPQSKETTAAPGIQFMEGDRKSGRVNTFA